ncbi:MAG: phosphoribosylglycinamide formyltransferase, partial [Actinomycetia bacterium]|nr:phosphoribosylglycinamide formyltransferase [Actinomycetes bacterium]
RPGCGAQQRAEAAGIPVVAVDPREYDSREQWNADLAAATAELAPDWLVSVGFMRVLGSEFLDRFPGRIINSHPSLLPAFPGARAVPEALDYGVRVTGCTIHLVDTGVDSGPILAQAPVAVHAGDDVDTLHERIKTVERELLVTVLANLVTAGYTLEGRKAALP